ncbi:hypothetical protein LTR12_002629 [Friedmanniomyces endolithicus]|nr:hypothetical protein LTR12_002629 [Friedmanniomyces endolithicus]
MSSNMKPIKLYSHAGVSAQPSYTPVQRPQPWKVAIFLNELDLAYETELMQFPDLKKEPFESINPNGRVPAIEDPNTGMKVWESGAIIEYLLETYDEANKSGLRYTSGAAKWEQKSWAYFQMSGQGPMYGQRAWFTFVSYTIARLLMTYCQHTDEIGDVQYHPEKNLTSCLDRYGNEIKRILSVINAHLKKSGRPYLCGEHASYADLMFVPWGWLAPAIMGEGFADEWKKSYPEAWAWQQKLEERPAVSKAREAREKANAK